jgi:hypothetical protein
MAPAAADSASGFPVKKAPSPVVTPEEVKKLREESAEVQKEIRPGRWMNLKLKTKNTQRYR